MKYRTLTVLIGASLMAVSAAGCSSDTSLDQDGEMETVRIEDYLLEDETESETDEELIVEADRFSNTETMELDLSEDIKETAAPRMDGETFEESTEAQSEENALSAVKTNTEEGETEQQTETEETRSVKNALGRTTGKAEDTIQTDEAAEVNAGVQNETGEANEANRLAAPAAEAQSEKQTETYTKPGSQKAETESLTEVEEQTEAESGEAETETEEQTIAESVEAETETEEQTKAESVEAETETEEQTEAESVEAETETEEQTEAESGETETETEEQTEAESGEIETEAEEQTEAESAETETETKEQTEAESGETEAESGEAETETETEEQTEDQLRTGEVSDQSIVYANDSVRVRVEPSTEAEIQSSLTSGMMVYALENQGEWCRIYYETDQGYVAGYIKTEFLSDEVVNYTAKEKVNLREEPSVDSEKVGELQEGEAVTVNGEPEGDWAEVIYTEDGQQKTAYVNMDYLELPENSERAERLEQAAQSFMQENGTADSGAENESEPQTAPAGEENENAGADSEAPESEADKESEPGQESEISQEVDSDAAESEADKESESGQESETSQEVDSEAPESEPEELAGETSMEDTIQLSEGAESQFELAKVLEPELGKVGIIYSSDNTSAETQLEAYELLAADYGIELITAEIEEEMDIDIEASQLVGSVDCIFCLDDDLVNGLVQTIRAYADEVEIPVFGVTEDQVSQGCIAAYEKGILNWNTEEAQKLGYAVPALENGSVEEK